MLRLFSALLLVAGLAACQPETPPEPAADAPYEVYGGEIAPDGAVPVQTVALDPAAYAGQEVTLEGVVTGVCQMKGCWLTLDAGDGTGVRVVVPHTDDGYAFTVPKDISGRTVVVRGTLAATTLDAATQAHLAEDAGEPADASAFETRPELQVTADAVLVKHS